MNLSLLEDAQVDAIEAIESFNQLAPTLGDQFEDELFSCFNRIKKDPKHFAENEGGFRSA